MNSARQRDKPSRTRYKWVGIAETEAVLSGLGHPEPWPPLGRLPPSQLTMIRQERGGVEPRPICIRRWACAMIGNWKR